MRLAEYLERQRAWSLRTFGPGRRTVGITAHITKELAEIRAAPDDLSEWIDVIILALDGYWRHGGDPAHVFEALVNKQTVNMGRRWPAPQPEDQPTEHLKVG